MVAEQSKLGRFSLGIGDRFGMEGKAQLRALKMALEKGVEIIPVWNKSNREHTLIGTEPSSTRAVAERAVKEEDWTLPYFVDADHVGLKTVDRFLGACDFFTLDVADFIGKKVPDDEIKRFVDATAPRIGKLRHPDLAGEVVVTPAEVERFARRYLFAVQEAGRIYAHIKKQKVGRAFVTEVSVDEAFEPQTPAEVYLLIAGLTQQGVAVETIAPKFSGKFLKGIDYVGDVASFLREFKSDLAVIELAKSSFPLPEGLKLSVHSGSDKFSLYPGIHSLVMKSGSGLHLKTAGTTWLEEVTGLAADSRGLALAKKIYAQAYDRLEELRGPYETVVEIERSNLPNPAAVAGWTSEEFISTLSHDPSNPKFNRDLRQLVHIGFRIAAELGEEFREELLRSRRAIERNVTDNLFLRHVQALFLGPD
jgi:hypothetical protein